LDGTRAAWRPALVASVFVASDGHPADFNEVVVISCPVAKCGLQFGVGADDVKIVDGKSTGPVVCHHCGWTDSIELENHQEQIGREHFARLKAEAHEHLRKTRIEKAHNEIFAKKREEIHAAAMEEATKFADAFPGVKRIPNS
jgi:hypothetical protein